MSFLVLATTGVLSRLARSGPLPVGVVRRAASTDEVLRMLGSEGAA